MRAVVALEVVQAEKVGTVQSARGSEGAHEGDQPVAGVGPDFEKVAVGEEG